MFRLNVNAAMQMPGAIVQSGEIRIRCPVHGSSSPTLCLRTNALGKALWHCHAGCESDDIRHELTNHGVLFEDSIPMTAPQTEQKSYPRHLLDDTMPIRQCPEALAYFQRRGLDATSVKDVFWNPSAQRVIQVVRDIAGEIIGLQTRSLGEKDHSAYGVTKGGAVRLRPIRNGRVAIAEGIETAMAYFQLTAIPCWSAVSSVGMKNFRFPNELQSLVIAADFDGAGLSAAEHLYHRARKQDIEAWLDIPGGNRNYRLDFNDILMRNNS